MGFFSSFLGFFADINNYLFTRKCFKILLEEYPKIDQTLELKLSPVGVLYAEIEFDANIDAKHHHNVLSAKFERLNESLLSMNLDGLVETESIRLLPYDNDGLMMERYIVKFVPYMRNVTWLNFFLWCFVLFVATRIIMKYSTQISKAFTYVYNFIF